MVYIWNSTTSRSHSFKEDFPNLVSTPLSHEVRIKQEEKVGVEPKPSQPRSCSSLSLHKAYVSSHFTVTYLIGNVCLLRPHSIPATGKRPLSGPTRPPEGRVLGLRLPHPWGVPEPFGTDVEPEPGVEPGLSGLRGFILQRHIQHKHLHS